ncbi:MAG: AraC family transcriptional regulator, partial [Paenibacillus sp.]|nr:AraC family transcriptional regulator [Paenibacillus sp.]
MNEHENKPAVRRTIQYTMTDIRYRVGSSVWLTELNGAAERLILIVTAGEGWIVRHQTRFRLERGKGYVFAPGTQVHFDYSGEQTACYYALTFETRRIGAGDSESGSTEAETFPDERVVEPHPFAKCVDLLEALYRYRLDSKAEDTFYQHIRFLELLGILMFRAGADNADSKNTRKAVERSIDRMRQQFRETLTVEQLAAEANVGRWLYTRLFREITGKIPLDFLNGLRINQAKQLLMTTDDRLHDIATNTGFSNEYYFNRRFKQTVGITPSQYRRRHQDRLPGNEVRVVSPYLEDFVLALGIRPIVQWSHAKWGKQDYLGLHTPEFEITSADYGMLTEYKPDLILLDGGLDRNRFEPYAPTYQLQDIGKDWRSTLRS